MRWARGLVVAMMVFGCGDNHDDGVSGSRLKLRRYVLDDGTTSLVGSIFDAELGEQCHLQVWGDGKSYCGPDRTLGVAFADAACTQSLGTWRDSACDGPMPTIIETQQYVGCATVPTGAFHVGARMSSTQLYERTQDGACAGPFDGSDLQLYAAGSAVELVEMTTSAVGDGRMRAELVSSADGLRWRTGAVFDSELDIGCFPYFVGSDTGVCVPFSSIDAFQFGDAACTTPVATGDVRCGIAPYATTFDEAACGSVVAIRRVGAKLDPPVYVEEGSGACVAIPEDPDRADYALGDEVQGAVFTRAHPAGDHRLSPSILSADGGALVPESDFYDTKLDTTCYPSSDDGSDFACLPAIATPYEASTHADCSAPFLAVDQPAGAPCSTPTAYAVITHSGSGTCPTITSEIHAIGDVVAGPVYRVGIDGGGCGLASTDGFEVHALGDVVPSSTFVHGTVVTDD